MIEVKYSFHNIDTGDASVNLLTIGNDRSTFTRPVSIKYIFEFLKAIYCNKIVFTQLILKARKELSLR